MAGAFHGVSEPDRVINVGVSGPGVVHHALKAVRGADFGVVAETIKRPPSASRAWASLWPRRRAEGWGVPFGIVDLSLAPTPAVGDSVARILEEMGLEVCGTHGTTAALALLNDAVKKGGVMASSSVGGLSGAFIPVSEDEGMIAAAQSGTLTLDKLEAMTCVCSVGPGYDRRPRFHQRRDPQRHNRRRGRDRHDKPEDHRREAHSRAGMDVGDTVGIRRPAGQRAHHARAHRV